MQTRSRRSQRWRAGPLSNTLGEAPNTMMAEAATASEPPGIEETPTAIVQPSLVPGELMIMPCRPHPFLIRTSRGSIFRQRVSSRAGHARAREINTTPSTSSASMRALASATPDAAAAGQAPAAAPVAASAAEYEERAPLMFKLDAGGPRASGRPSVRRSVTKESVQSAWWTANDYYKVHGTSLSKAYGNFDRLVALGWLLGEVTSRSAA